MSTYDIANRIHELNPNLNRDLVLAQIQHESADGTSDLAVYDHNYGGVTATDGMKYATGTAYASFDSDEEFAQYMSRFLPKFGLEGVNDVDTYAQLLKDNGYYTATLEEYSGGMKGFLSQGGSIPQSPQVLDWENLMVNTDDQSVTNTDNLRQESIYGLNLIGKWGRDNTGHAVMITGGAETFTHADGEFSHHTGWKADVWVDDCTGGTEMGKLFKEYVNSLGYSCNWEEDHWDIDFSGHDTRDPQTPKVQFGDFWTESGIGDMLDNQVGYLNDPANFTGQPTEQAQTLGFWEAMAQNFWDSVSSTGVASFVQTLWGHVAHSGGERVPVTQEDIDYVKNALPNDKEAQEYCLLNGLDSEEIKWLVNQKLVDKQRREAIESFKAGHEWTIENALVKSAGALGYLVDPLNFLPVASSLKALKALEKTGKAITNVSKLQKIAEMSIKSGLQQSAYATADDYLRKTYGGEKVDYANTALMSFFAGGVLSAGGGLFKMLNKGGVASRVATKADHAEDVVIRNAVSPETVAKAGSETIESAKKLHDVSFGAKLKSKVYSKLEANGKIVATTYENARKLIEDASGKVLPKSVKAMYVPNEDYTILLTDRVSPKEVDKLLAHEVGVHGGLKKALGEKGYNSLMRQVKAQSEKEGTVFYQAREKAGNYDPEEIFAQAVEDGMLPDDMWSKIKGFMNKNFAEEGYEGVHMDMKRIQEIMQRQIEAKRNPYDIYINEDGSTAFAGMKFSQDNLVNPKRLADVIELEQGDITKVTQGRLGSFGLQKLGKLMEQGIFGLGINSLSNTFRKYTSRIWEDARGRGLGSVNALPAETYKMQIAQQLAKPYEEYCSIRQSYVMQNKIDGIMHPEASRRNFDKLVMEAYNTKYGGNKANVRELSEYPKEVLEAMEKLHDLRNKQIEIGKNSSRNAGSTNADLIDKDWYAVDDELWRITDRSRVGDLILGNFTTTAEKTAKEQASDFFTDYFMKFAKRDVIKDKILRNIKLANKSIKEQNDKLIKEKGKDAKTIELKSEVVTDADVETYLKTHVPNAVNQLLEGTFDPVMVTNADAKLGKLSFLQERIPMDTSGVVELPTGNHFSFDNNLRLYDMDDMVLKNIHRFAGECALKTVFKDDAHLRNFLRKVDSELQTAVANGKMDRGSATSEYRNLDKAIAEFRGLRVPEHSDEVFGKFGALCRIAKNLSYAKNGANMGFNQFGELAGTIVYGGVRQMFHIIPKLGEWIDDITAGKVDSTMVRSVEDFMFGSNMESKIFTHSWGDKMLRDALTEKTLVNSVIKTIADGAYNLGKYTSAINMLPKMTESMLRGMRTGFITDSIREAHGDVVNSIFRNPFSPQKLKAGHVTPEQWEHIKENLRKYSTMDNNGKITGLDVNKWFKEDVVSYQKWYNLIQLQAERGMTPANRQGNKNLLKSSNSLWSLFFQFKDYTLRSMNAQTFRAMTARDIDDKLASMFSIATNAGVYIARAGMTYGAYKASGMDERAESYKEYMLSQNNLARAIATRSAIVGTPLSFINDAYEATIADSSIRTTVDSIKSPRSKDMSSKDIIGKTIGQLPAVKELSAPLDVANVISHAEGDKFTKRDLDTLTRLIPIPRLWLMTVGLDKGTTEFAKKMGIPEK